MPEESKSPKIVHCRGTARSLPGFVRAAISLFRFGRLVGYAGPDKLGQGARVETTDSGQLSWES